MVIAHITRQIKEDIDDTSVKVHTWSNNDPWIYFGDDRGRNGSISLRFEDITIPPGSTLKLVQLRLHCSTLSRWIDCRALINAELAADPLPITSYDDFYARPQTTAEFDWNITNPWYGCSDYRSPQLSDILREILDSFELYQAHLQFFIHEHHTRWGCNRYIDSYKRDPSRAAILRIEYQPPTYPERPYWLIIEKEHLWTPTGKTITVTTDLWCHLKLRWSPYPPGRHERLTIRRGVDDYRDPHFGFEEYTEVDQSELGDSPVHTFGLFPFPPYPEIWYYFVGSIQGGDTKSRSPFFHQESRLFTLTLIHLELWQCPWPAPTDWNHIFTEFWP